MGNYFYLIGNYKNKKNVRKIDVSTVLRMRKISVNFGKKKIMKPIELELPLNRHQLEILKLFSRDLEDKDLIAIKRLIVRYLGEKITKMADEVWEEKNWTNDDMRKLLNSHERTPYDPKN